LQLDQLKLGRPSCHFCQFLPLSVFHYSSQWS